MHARRWLAAILGAVFGVCFAALAAGGISVLVITPHHWRASSFVFAVVCACLAYLSFRAATSGRTDHASFQRALVGGVGGAFVGFLVVLVAYLMYRQEARGHFVHPLGLHSSQVSMAVLMAALVCLGFGAGFALRTRTLHRR